MADEREEGPDDLDQPPPFFPYDPEEQLPSDTRGEPVEVTVEGVFAAEAAGHIQRFVVVSDGRRRLPILIGPFEAQAISLPMDGIQPDRPMSHDLMRTLVDRLGGKLERVIIDDLWSTTYYAKLYVRQGEELMEIDSRPSDAIALALRLDAPIYVSESILAQGASE